MRYTLSIMCCVIFKAFVDSANSYRALKKECGIKKIIKIIDGEIDFDSELYLQENICCMKRLKEKE